MTLRARDTVTGELVLLTKDPASADHLPTGNATNGRYLCEMCGSVLSLSRRSRPTSSYTPRFAHPHQKSPDLDVCSARADVQQRINDDVQVVIDLGTQLAQAWPGATVCVEYPEPARPGQPSEPPVVVCRDGDQTLVIERPRGELSTPAVQHRFRAVRDRYGPKVMHLWFFAEDPRHFREGDLRPKAVRPDGEPRSIRHRRVHPTEQQLAIVKAGGRVFWVDGHNVLVPYGGRDFAHTPRRGEDWKGEAARYRQDWAISHPIPAPDATWWGLVPIGLTSLRGTKVAFHPRDAYDVMERLEAAQPRRWAASRRRAREQFNRANAPASPPAPQQQEPVPTPPEADTTPTTPPAPTSEIPTQPEPTSERAISPATPPSAPPPPVPPMPSTPPDVPRRPKPPKRNASRRGRFFGAAPWPWRRRRR
ncbi:hypothetical protein [Streptomyces sp. NPDC093097]|uniref:hypothetical protein n=1 Tax=Streptomyces sp. NPDC093097 TaxID=3366027 RepID=UPI0038088FB1